MNSARVSMGKQVDQMSEGDWRLIDYLWSHEHTSPFRHVQFQFHLKVACFCLAPVDETSDRLRVE